MTAPASPSRTLSDYLDMATRHRLLLIGATVAGMAVGGIYTGLAPREYQSQTQVLVAPTGAETSVVAQSRSKTEINLDTEAQLVTSTAVAKLAAKTLGVKSRDAATLAGEVEVSVPPNTSILTIAFTADSPAGARDGAEAFADAYLVNRVETAKNRLAEQMDVVDGELAGLEAERGRLTQELSKLDESDFDYVVVKNSRGAVDSEITEWTSLKAQLTSASSAVSAGRVISEPRLPQSASSPKPLVAVAGGTLLGALAGVSVASVRQRFAARVWHASDVSRRCDVDVIAVVHRDIEIKTNDVFAAFSPGGRVFGRLRNEVVAALGPAPHRVIVVAGVSSGSASSVCAANLAAALARAGSPSVAVAAHPSGPFTVTSLLDAPAVPGLSDVFADRSDLARATHRAARHPLLDVIGPGGCGTATGPSRDTIAKVYSQLRDRASYVVVDAPPMTVSADAQLLAADADAVLIAVECGKDKVEDVAEAVQAMHRIDAPLLGAVALPRMPAPTDEPEAPTRRGITSESSRRTVTTVRDERVRRGRPPTPRRRGGGSGGGMPTGDDRPTDMIPVVEDDDPLEAIGDRRDER